MKRSFVKKSKDKKIFSATAKKVDFKNFPRTMMRGGIRL